MDVRDVLAYSRDHGWVQMRGTVARTGLTHQAQDALGEVTFVVLPTVGRRLALVETCAEVESAKSISELPAPVAGTVCARNDRLEREPSLVNRDPYGAGWLLEIETGEARTPSHLMDADAYRAFVAAAGVE